MTSDPAIVLSHPGMGIFIQQTGRALYEAGLLKRFVTTLADRPDAFWRQWLPGRLDRLLQKRAVTQFPARLVCTFGRRELLRLFTREFDWTRGVLGDRVWRWSEYGFDRWVARYQLGGAEAIYGYDHACLESFRAARRRNMACFYEVPAPESGYAQQLRDQEIAAHPELDSLYERRLRRTLPERQERRRQEWALADVIIASSEFTKKTYAQNGHDVSRLRVIPLAAPKVCAEEVLAARDERRKAGRPLRFLSMGLFALHKGSHYLLKGWGKFHPGARAQLDVVGGLDLPAAVLRGLPDSVHLHGAVPPTAALDIYGAADVLVFPTLADGFGMVVSEALSQGLPVITTPHAGAAEMITHGREGLIVPPANADALAEAMQWCLDNREDLIAMGERARETAARWQWEDYRKALVETVTAGLSDRAARQTPASSERTSPATICLITPAHLSSNPRLVKEANTLQAAGYQTHVVAVDMAASLRGMDQTILARAQWQRTLVRRGTWPQYAWLTLMQRCSQWLLEKRLGYGGRVALAKRAHHRLTRKLGEAAADVPADLYHAHNLGALAAAAYAAKRNGARVGFDAEDFHSGELTEEQESRGEHQARCILESALLHRCDLLTAASPGIAAEYRRLYGVDMHALLNVFPLEEAPARPATAEEVGEDGRRLLSLYWFSQTIGPGRGLEQLVLALGRMEQPVRLYLRGRAVDGFMTYLREAAREAGLQDVIRVLPSTAPADLIRASAGYDLGLALEMDHPRNRALCLTNKIFAYLLAGLPVLLSRTPAQEALSADLGQAARLIDLTDPPATAQCLDEFASNEDSRRTARTAAWKLGHERYNWDVEQVVFLDLIRATLATLPQ